MPIHKKGSKIDATNYRPICKMSNLGKLLELVVLRKVDPFIDDALSPSMHGFRKGKGTETALV